MRAKAPRVVCAVLVKGAPYYHSLTHLSRWHYLAVLLACSGAGLECGGVRATGAEWTLAAARSGSAEGVELDVRDLSERGRARDSQQDLSTPLHTPHVGRDLSIGEGGNAVAPTPEDTGSDLAEGCFEDSERGGAVQGTGAEQNAWLGLELSTTRPRYAGVVVAEVIPHSPAADAGMMRGDEVFAMKGRTVSTPREIDCIVSGSRAFDTVSVGYYRRSARRLTKAKLTPQPDREQLLRLRFVGRPAPELDGLKLLRGGFEATIGALRGKVVVVEFWGAWCPPCHIVVPTLVRWQRAYGAEGFTVLGITTDDFQTASNAAYQLDMDFPVATDPEGRTTLGYHAHAIPSLFLIDRHGVVREVMVAYSSDALERMEGLFESLLEE